jgi:hypothetical protein
MYPIGILNTSIVTADGEYTLATITTEEARALVADATIDSAVGHVATAELLSELLGVEVPVNRQLFIQQPGQRALVLKLDSRPPKGKILSPSEMADIGYSFKILRRVS